MATQPHRLEDQPTVVPVAPVAEKAAESQSRYGWQQLENLRAAIAATVFGRGRLARVLTAASTLATSTAVAQAITSISAIALARLYTPAQLGSFGIYLALLAPLVVVSSWRYESCIPIAKGERTASILLVSSVVIGLVNSVLLLAAFIGGRAWLKSSFGLAGASAVIWVVPGSLAAVSMYQALVSWALRKNTFQVIASTRIRQCVVTTALQVGLGFSGLGALGLALGDCCGRLSGLRVLAIGAFRQGAFQRPTWERTKRVLKRYAGFPLVNVWAALLSTLSLQLPGLLLPGFFGTDIAGHYAMSYRLLGLPATVVGQAMNLSMFSALARIRTDAGAVKELVERTAGILIAIATPLFVIPVFAGPKLIPLLFGDRWAAAGGVIQVLAPWFFVWFLASPLSSILTIQEDQKTIFRFGAAEFALRLISLLAGLSAGSPAAAFYGLSITGAILSGLALRRFLLAADVELKPLALSAGKCLLCSSVLSLPLFWLPDTPIAIVAAVTASTISYYILLYGRQWWRAQ